MAKICKAPSFLYDPMAVRLVHRYILREILVPFGLGLGVFTLILLIARILKLVEMVVNRGVPLLEVLALLTYILPAFLELTVPMAVLLAVLVAFGRLASDSELTALKASGVSLNQLAVPVWGFATVVCLLCVGLSLYARPWGNRLMRTALYDIAKLRASAGLKEKVFNDDFTGLVIFVDRIVPPGNLLHGMLIADTREPEQRNTILANAGRLIPDETLHLLTLRLQDGQIHTFYRRDRSYQRTDFATYDLTLDLNATLAGLEPREPDASEMTLAELRERISAPGRAGESSRREVIEVHRKFSIPFACLTFAAVGIPLGIRPSRAVHSRGLGISLVLILAYYLFLSLGQSLAERGTAPPAVAMWLPNLLFSSLALWLFRQAARESFHERNSPIRSRVTRLRERLDAVVRRWRG